MAALGRNRTTANPAGGAHADLAQVRYLASGPNALGIDVLTVSELRHRVSAGHLRRSQRIEFYLLMAVTRGRCTHWVDFTAHDCRPRSWVIVQPGQVQRFDAAAHWDGRIVLFQPPCLLPRGGDKGGMVALPNHLTLNTAEHRTCFASVEQMSTDARESDAAGERLALLHHQLQTLLLRLRLAQRRQYPPAAAAPRGTPLFERFREALEADFASVHQLRDYAARLVCSEKSLSRSTLAMAGVSAKAFVSQRIALEAKRLLVHSALPVSTIGIRLGIDETTNFVKFFRREVGCTPTEFRREHGDIR